jgi:hydrogenase expression/formation protein HypC
VCLALPGRICAVQGDAPLSRRADVDFGGARREVSLAFVPEAAVGDFVIVHVGVALQRLDEDAALALLREIDSLAGSAAADAP